MDNANTDINGFLIVQKMFIRFVTNMNRSYD